MESKRESTRYALARSFKKLMMKHAFDKITIKMITDDAGFIRPTFYNYFYDKHEVLEWIFEYEVENHVNSYMDRGEFHNGLYTIFEKMGEERDFYIKAFKVNGQNSFSDIVKKHIYKGFSILYDAVNDEKTHLAKSNNFNKDILCNYYANGLVFMLELWLREKEYISPIEWADKYSIIVDIPILDVMRGNFKHESYAGKIGDN